MEIIDLISDLDLIADKFIDEKKIFVEKVIELPSIFNSLRLVFPFSIIFF